MYSTDRAEATDFRDSEGFDIVGDRCALETCGELDFLPFVCNYCQKRFCKKHAEPCQHDCQLVPKSRGILAVTCPKCGLTVKWDDAESTEAATLEAHSTTCQMQTQDASADKQVCPAKGCKTKLTASNSVNCEKCKVRVCLKHRFEDAHDCMLTKGQWLSRLGAAEGQSARPAAQNWGSGCATNEPGSAPQTTGSKASAAAAAADRRAGRSSIVTATSSSAPDASAPGASGARVKELYDALGGSDAERSTCKQTMKRLLENVSADPVNPKFRVIKRDNKAIREKILQIPGAEALLKAIGFEDRGDTLDLPETVTKKRIDAILQLIF